jgi:exoribonuclease R
MPMRRTVIRGADLSSHLRALRAELSVPSEFPAEVLAEAEAAVVAPRAATAHTDATDIPLVTLDPPGSRDLDQAFFIARGKRGGYAVTYAIADVATFVAPGGAVDREAHRRGETLYLPDGRVPLHPPSLSESAASLLPGEDRPAVLWRFDLDRDGEPRSVDVRRAFVRSRAQLDYPSFAETGGDLVALLEEVGERRQERERHRGGVSLPVPEQEVAREGQRWVLRYRAPLPVEAWNAQVSLLTGMAAARLMLEAGVGMLRTMPPPDERTVGYLRRSARALGVDWPTHASYAAVVRRLDATVPAQAAVLRLASTLFRGAGYAAFDGTPPEQMTQSAVAAPYAHATAPLRRLGDRYVSECCLAAGAGTPVPDWVRAALPALPKEMAGADRHAHDVDRAVVDLAEALVLEGRVGEVLRGVVVDVDGTRGQVQLSEPAVRGRLTGTDLPLGDEVSVRLVQADPATRRVEFTLA